jgi:hypothetical protein
MSRRALRPILILVAAVLFGVVSIRPSRALEPRPWLCRQIPVFSNNQPMTWKATRRGAGRWVLTFMHYDPAGGHDGFTVVSTRDVDGSAQGTLEAGQWYVVALHRAGEHWICPANASPTGASAGYVSSLCYGADEDSCDVRLIVQSANKGTSSH